MSETTQDGRMLNISTPLGKDYLLLNQLTATEEISGLFYVEVELLHEENQAGRKPTMVDAKELLGQAVTIAFTHRDATARTLSGIVNRFSQADRDKRFTYYYATIVPNIWILTQNIQSRIFQHQTVPEILKKVFEGFEVSYEIQRDLKPRNFCVQYNESDFDFASRLMEEEGIYYFFDHTGGTDKLVIADTPQSHRDCPGKSELEYYLKMTEEDVFVSSIGNFKVDYQLQSGKVSNWDHNFELPHNKLDSEQPSLFNVGGNQKLEHYEYPGNYSRKYDGIDRSGGERPSDLQNVFPDKQTTVENRMGALDAGYRIAGGYGSFCGMTAGYKFKLKGHPTGEYNTQYIITSITHQVEQSPTYTSEDIVPEPYTNTFDCIAHGSGNPAFLPLRRTPKPTVRGSQTATVVGPSGEEIFTDKYGRVKVQFHWDREGKYDSDSSCWLRVVQSWAGNQWGSMFIPRIGMEVMVDFLESDPDRPIITGCVYNKETMPPYTLPDEKTKMTIKSDSTKGGGGFNELRFEDKKGKEQIFIHAQKSMDIRVRNDRREFIGSDRHLIVNRDKRDRVRRDEHRIIERDLIEQIERDYHRKIEGKAAEEITQDYSRKIGLNNTEEVGLNFSAKTGAFHTIAAEVIVLEARSAITLKVGNSFININQGGIQIDAPLTLINSGGLPLDGMQGTLVPPLEPEEAHIADNAEPGSKAPSYRNQKRQIPSWKQQTFTNPTHKPNHLKNEDKISWIEIKLVDEQDNPVPGQRYRITLPDGSTLAEGTTDREGMAKVTNIDPGNCKITFPNLDQDMWTEA